MTLSHCRPDAKHAPGECVICDYYQNQFTSLGRQFPHCDAYIVHAPLECEYCDKYADDLQVWREENSVNFTGEENPDKIPCPASTRRDIKKIHRWYGNAPAPKSCLKCGIAGTYINLVLACPKHGPI